MKKSAFTFIFLLSFGYATLFSDCLAAVPIEEDEGEVLPTVITTATVPNRLEDYQLSISSIPRKEVLPGQEITYTIFYGCSGGNGSPEMELSVSWFSPEGVVLEFVPRSATPAYGKTFPRVDEVAQKIVWSIIDFPPETTSQRVSFKLKVSADYEQSGTFPIEVKAYLRTPGISQEASLTLSVTYLEEGFVSEVPLVVWRYMQEMISWPAFRFLIPKLALLLLLWMLLFGPFITLARLDVGISFLPHLISHFWTWLLILLGIRKGPPVWGRVFVEDSRFPLFLVRVSVFDFSGNFLGRCLTDRRGRFGFSLPEKRYLLQIHKPGFYISSLQNAGVILSGDRFIFSWKERKEDRRRVWVCLKKWSSWASFAEEVVERVAIEFSDFTLILGLILGLVNLYFLPSIANAFLVFLYLLFFSFWTALAFR